MQSLGGSTLPPLVPGCNNHFNFTHHLRRIIASAAKSSENLGLISLGFLQEVPCIYFYALIIGICYLKSCGFANITSFTHAQQYQFNSSVMLVSGGYLLVQIFIKLP